MKPETRDKLFEAWAYCDHEDKSTEFMLTYMSDIVPNWDESDVVEWISKNSSKRKQWYKNNPNGLRIRDVALIRMLNQGTKPNVPYLLYAVMCWASYQH